MEDAQPNEVRLSRKGSTSIPTVRTSHHGGSRGRPATTFRNRGRGRGRGNPFPFCPLPRPQTLSGPHLCDPLPHKSGPHAPHAATTLPPSRFSSDSRPLKRARLDIPDSSAILARPHPQNSPWLSGSGEKYPKREYVKLKLPPNCCQGEYGQHKARRAWIKAQKQYLEIERHLSVLESRYLEPEQSVLFVCRPARDNIHCTESLARESKGTFIQPASAKMDFASTRVENRAGVPSLKIGSLSAAEGYDDRCGFTKAIRTDPIIVETSSNFTQNMRTDSRRGLTTDVRPAARPPSTKLLRSPSQAPGDSLGNQLNPTQRVMGQQVAPSVAPANEEIIDLTLGPSSPVSKERPARWMTFRSGILNVTFPPCNSGPSRSPPSERVPPQNEGHASSGVDHGSDQLCGPLNPMVQTGDEPGEDSDLDVLLSDSVHRHGDPTTTHADCSPDQPIVHEDEPEVFLAPLGPTLTCGTLRLPLGSRDRPRRVLHDRSFVHVVTAHGVIDQVSETGGALELRRDILSPVLPFEEFVEDACVLPLQDVSAIVLAHAREENQLTLLASTSGQISQPRTLHRDWNRAKKSGVSALAALTQPLKFASGGHDHRVHLWDVTQNVSGASATELAIKHTAMINSLLPITDTSHKLVSIGADCNIHLWDMSAERVARSFKTSSIPYHAHKIDSPFCTLLEVAHLEMQFELRDLRMVPKHAVQRFGFLAAEKHGRFIKGDTWSHFFVCGDRLGGVRLWDLRNVSRQPPPFQCFSDPVVQVVKTGSHVLACSKKNELALINLHGG
ncbi:hypothetical protein PAXRUDRAFT_832556 [Paxillus rubicundulus Ve08.2h10]|uniref:Guanine nucleotide-binding protein subunit beta-like protein n=1 Tax=Paxillus rubicundulus Ve08.2h10 TaxID=930991 RepID=A0A0D0D1D8_9AGAM|nr:hypothetical protein PAXRUDRAFT_832556 [Paxillus rubicundulus Ve08.2h10]